MDDEIKIAVALKGKVAQLIDLYENEKEKTLRLRDKVAGLEKQIERLEADNEVLKETNCQLKLATAFKSTGDTSADAMNFIDELVREIDECVTLLNR
jgi:phage shock protein A